MQRRHTLVSTLSDIQTSLLLQYADPTIPVICRYSYASSRNCDIYQLGELTRFLHKHGSVSLASTMAGTAGLDPYDGDLYKAISKLKTCPPYQINEEHQHCGPRGALVERLEFMEVLIPMTTLCQPCWVAHKEKIRWTEPGLLQAPSEETIKTTLSYKLRQPWAPGSDPCYQQHYRVRRILMAEGKNWSLFRSFGI
jgi:hypothetical protein